MCHHIGTKSESIGFLFNFTPFNAEKLGTIEYYAIATKQNGMHIHVILFYNFVI